MEDIVYAKNGRIEYRKFEDGINYAVYIPDNVNEDTNIFTYVYGSGQKKGWYSGTGSGYGPYDALIENASDSIVIMPDMRWGEAWGPKSMDIVESVKTELGVTNTNISGGGFSYGGFGGYEVVAENLRRNGASNLPPQVVYFIDDYSKKTHDNPNAVLNDDAIELFKENNTVFFTFASKSNDADATKRYAKAGLNVIRVECQEGEHMTIKKNFFQNQVYDYMDGGVLPQEGYTYQKYVYDEETGKWSWVDINYESIATLDKLYQFYGTGEVNSVSQTEKLMNLEDLILKSDDKVLETSLNAIRAAIRSTGMLSSPSVGGFSSTTKMPSGVPAIVSSYASSTVSLLTKLANETSQFARIGESINEMNFNLERKVSEIEEPIEIEEMNEIPVKEESTSAPTTTVPPTQSEVETTTEPKKEENKAQSSQEQKSESKEQNNTTKEQNNIPKEQAQTRPQQTSPSYSGSNGGASSSQSSQASPSQEQPPTRVEPSEKLDDFPSYADVVSDNNKYVFQNRQGYKLVIHKDGSVINGVEHYYDFGSQENAIGTLKTLKSAYQGNQYLSQIIQEGQYIKVIFNNDIYKNYDLNTIINLYTNLDGYNKI